jgi:hypothetical protein
MFPNARGSSHRAALVLAIALLPLLSRGAELVLHTNVECRVTVDGKDAGTLVPNQGLHLQLASGGHRIEALSAAGGNKWEKSIDLDRQLAVTISLDRGFWTDPNTKLSWTSADNGSGLSWSQALRYCRELSRAGFEDWTLPSIDNLQGIFDSAENTGGFHIKAPIKMTGWQWSSTPGSQSGEGWAFDFGDGGRASVYAGDSGLNRALCVRTTSPIVN